MTPEEQHAAMRAGMDKVVEGVQEYVTALRDEGDAEILVDCAVLYESQGIEANGSIFSRVSYFLPSREPLVRTRMLGLLDLAGTRLRENLTARRTQNEA